MSERAPFPANGDSNGAVPVTQDGLTSAGASDATTNADVPPESPPASEGVRCKCGAEQHATDSNICARGHGWLRNRKAEKHRLYAQQPLAADAVDGDVASMASAEQRHQVLRHLFDAISREASRYADASRTHRLSARDQQHLLNLLDRLREIDDRLRQMDAAPTTDGGEALADWPKRLALVFANQPDQFAEFITAVLTADRDVFGPLRSQVRLTLEHLEPQGKPMWRGNDADDDTVLL